MTMHLTHDGAPGHVADAHEHGWACSCGAGNTWEDERPRSRGAGGARRHLTAAARNNPAYREEISAAVAEDDAPAETPEPEAAAVETEPEPEAAPLTYAEQLRAAQDAAAATRATMAEFRSPPAEES